MIPARRGRCVPSSTWPRAPRRPSRRCSHVRSVHRLRGGVRRRADGAQLLQRLAVAETLRLGERVSVRQRLARRPVADLSAADVGRHLLGEARGVEHAERRAPGVPEDRHLVLPEALAHRVDQLVEIGDELLDRHRGSGDTAVERLAGAALVPVDDGEALLERRVEVTEETRLAEARPAVQQDQRAGWRGSRRGSSPTDRARRDGDTRSRRCCPERSRHPARERAASSPRCFMRSLLSRCALVRSYPEPPSLRAISGSHGALRARLSGGGRERRIGPPIGRHDHPKDACKSFCFD